MTDEQREKVIQLLAEKWTSNKIAKELGISRNAVCGLRHRHNIKAAHPSERVGVERKYRKKETKWRGKPVAAPPMQFEDVVVPDHSKMIHELGEYECKFSVTSHNEPPAKHRFCGKPSKDKSPYCEEHHKVCREPNNASKRKVVHFSRGAVRLPSGLHYHY